MNELQIFNSGEFGEIRTIEIDGKPYFVGTDVAKALGYNNPRDAVSRHCKGVVKHDTPTSSGVQSMSYINEGDLYRLIMKSKLPSAEKFESWVMDEVFPTIRKTGSYKPIYELAELFRIACSSNEAFMELSEEDQERFWLIIDALMMNDLEDLKRVHNLANYLMIKRIKDNVKAVEA